MSRHYLIDGYNVIKRDSALGAKSLEEGRQALLTFIHRQRPQGSDRNRVTVVFDGKPGMYGLPVSHGASVVFTEYETADDWIKRSVEEARNKKEIIVVTDDRALLLYVRALAVGVMAVGEFLRTDRSHRKSKSSRADQPKVISAVFENVVNQELEKKWLSKINKPNQEI